ncbi:MAG: 50S ribosomal protein L25 [Gemmatimonadota bacterium]|nr:50S ribosomal protein L25 [Gemmatimonadota bacterium]MDE2984057.1 50S ribosomal protein L25 [Gemmatimonadota bacterium]
MEAKIDLETRTGAGKGVARKLRRAGRVPGVIYGGGGDNVLVSMKARETVNVLQSVPVEETVFELSVDGGEAERARIREVQVHPYRPELLHVDFLRVQPDAAGDD